MKEMLEFKLNLEKTNIQDILVDNALLLKKIEEAESFSTLKDYIKDNLNNKDGAPEITNLTVKELVFVPTTHTGKFRLSFNILRHYTCSNTKFEQVDYVDFDFRLIDNLLIAKTIYFVWEVTN